MLFLLLSFVYGVFHSLGPGGHAKTLVSGYLLTSPPAGLLRSIMFGALVALGHAVTAFVIVFMLYYVLKTTVSGGFDSATYYLSRISYVFILCLGLFMLAKKLFKIRHTHEHKRSFWLTGILISLSPCPGGAMVLSMFAMSNGMPVAGAIAVLFMAMGGMALTIGSVAVISYLVKSSVSLQSRGGRILPMGWSSMQGYLFCLVSAVLC